MKIIHERKRTRIMMKNYKTILLFGFLIICTLFVNCIKKEQPEPQSRVLVEVGDRAITVNEFLKRAEYTIRPPYCKSDYGVSKKIVLNSLIAEKMMALEENPDSVIERGTRAAKYIQGRKEQAMRRYHFYMHGSQKVELDTSEIKDIYKLAGRKYRIKYFTFPDPKLAQEFMKRLEKNDHSFEKAIKGSNTEDEIKIPEKEVKFNSNPAEGIHAALYSKKARNLSSGDIVGPVETNAKDYVIMQIESITRKVGLSNEQIKVRYNDVKNKLIQRKGRQIYAEYVQELMSGKKMNFNRQVFGRLAGIFSEIYSITKKQEKQTLNKAVWGKNIEQELSDSLGRELNDYNPRVFFTLNGEEWTVEDFREALLTHPLVFRKKDIQGQRDFTKQFKLAIADLIRDHFITRDAYEDGYDQRDYVKNYTNMWRDEILATYNKYQYLKTSGYDGNFEKNYMQAINNYLNQYVDILQKKYNKEIFIDTEAFNEIELTGIDLVALESNVPYPIVVPNFPIVTTDAKLDYGQKMGE